MSSDRNSYAFTMPALGSGAPQGLNATPLLLSLYRPAWMASNPVTSHPICVQMTLRLISPAWPFSELQSYISISIWLSNRHLNLNIQKRTYPLQWAARLPSLS